jgi:hypothetical protein
MANVSEWGKDLGVSIFTIKTEKNVKIVLCNLLFIKVRKKSAFIPNLEKLNFKHEP